MSSQQPGSGNNQSQQAAGDAAASVGHATSGEAGSSPGHETQAETGGSGGAGLTASQSGAAAGQPAKPRTPPNRQGEVPADAEVVIDSGARGAQDTRSRQAGGSKTGLGTPETGANQSPADFEHKK